LNIITTVNVHSEAVKCLTGPFVSVNNEPADHPIRRSTWGTELELERGATVLPKTTITIGVLIALAMVVIGTISSIIRFSGTLNSGWTRIARGLLILAFIVMQRVITLGRNHRA
jgi:hypothetical protein